MGPEPAVSRKFGDKFSFLQLLYLASAIHFPQSVISQKLKNFNDDYVYLSRLLKLKMLYSKNQAFQEKLHLICKYKNMFYF